MGFTNGSLSVYSHLVAASSSSSGPLLKESAFRKDFQEEVTDIKVSPNNEMLAAGSRDNFIIVYSCILSVSEPKRWVDCLVGIFTVSSSLPFGSNFLPLHLPHLVVTPSVLSSLLLSFYAILSQFPLLLFSRTDACLGSCVLRPLHKLKGHSSYITHIGQSAVSKLVSEWVSESVGQ